MIWLRISNEFPSRFYAEVWAAKMRMEYLTKGIMLDIRQFPAKRDSWCVWRSTNQNDHVNKTVWTDRTFDNAKTTARFITVVDYYREIDPQDLTEDSISYGQLSSYELYTKGRVAKRDKKRYV